MQNLRIGLCVSGLAIKLIMTGIVALSSAQVAIGQQQFGTALEARGMLERVIAGLKADPDATLLQINNGDKKFSDRDLYPTCAGPDGKMIANPNPARLGIIQKDSKDASGKPYGEELARAQEGVVSEVTYMSPRPGADKTPVLKIGYFTKTQGYICLVGYTP